MKKRTANLESPSNLRQKAEEQLKLRNPGKNIPTSESNMLKLIHELEVHQIELEMQNDELILANNAAREATEKYQELYDFAPSGYFTLSRKGLILELNLLGAQMLGKERSKLINSLFGFFVKEDSRKAFSTFLDEVFQGDGTVMCEIPIVPDSNTNIHLHLSGIMTEGGEYCRITAIDITKRKKAEDDLKTSLAKYKVLIDSFPIGITISDPAGKIIETNEKAIQILGLSREEHLKRNIKGEDWKIIKPDGSIFPEDEYASVKALNENRLVENVEMGIERPDGKISWINVTAVPIPIDDFGVLIAYHDISRRTIAENTLHENEERMRLALKATNDVVWDWDIINDSQRWNDAGEKVFGWSEIVNNSVNAAWWKVRVHPDDRKRVIDGFNEAVYNKSGNFWQDEYRFLKSDGTYAEVIDRAYVLRNNSGKPTRMIGAMLDITEKRKAENEIKWTLESIKDGFFSLDKNWNFVYLNDAAETLVGSRREEMLGKNHWEFYPGTKGTLIESNYLLAAAEKRVIEWDNYYEPWGRWFHIRVYPREGGGVSSFFQDITERKKMEADLQESEMQNTLLFQNSMDGIMLTSPDGRIFSANPAMCELLGMSETEICQAGRKGIVDPNDPKLPLLIKERNEKGWVKGELNMVHKSGTLIPVEFSSTVFTNLDGEQRTSMIIHDNRERKFVEAERHEHYKILEEYHETLKKVFGIARIGTWTNDLSGNVWWSEEIFSLFGFDPKTYKPDFNTMISLVHPEDKDRMDRWFKGWKKGQKQDAITWRAVLPDGSQKYIEAHGNIILDEKGEFKFLAGISQDITSRVLAEKALRESEEKMQSIFRVAPTGIGLVSNRILLEVNPKICEMTGYSTYELVGKSSRIFYPSQKEFDLVGDEKYAQIAKYGTGIVETQWQRKDGEIIDILLSSTPADPDDLSRGVIFTALDITERKRAEIMIYESEKAFAEINKCLVGLGADYQDNINTLTALCGKLLGATCALYNRLEGDMLCSFGQWSVPADYNAIDKAEGHICYDVIRQGKSQVFLVKNLPETPYFESDPNVKKYKLVTYAGHAVFSGDEPLGSLCVVFQRETDLSARDIGILSIIASALASEEQRYRSHKTIEEGHRKYRELSTLMRLLADNIPDMLWAKNLDKEYIFANKALCDNLLNATDTEEPLGKTDMFFANRQRNTHPANPQWHTFGEICSDSDSITLKEMKALQFDEYGNVRGKFLFLDVHKAPLYDEEGQLIGVVGSGRDVTAAKEAENQLRKLSQAVQQSPASVVITNPQGTIEYVNPKFTEVTGYTLEEAIGKNPRILKSGDQTQEYYKVMWETISKGKLWKGEFHNKKKNGELYWESALISPIMNEKGEILNYLAVKEDITEKVLVNNALRENEMKLRVVANYNYDWEYWIDPNGEFKYCSPSSYRITGHHADEFLADGSLLQKCIHPNDRKLFSVHQHTISGSDNIQELSFRIIKPDGTIRCIGHVCQEIYDDKGVFLGRRGSNRDITQRRLAEENLRLSEEKYRLLADNSADVIWMTDSEGYYTYVSPSVEKLYGYKPEEAIGLSMMMAVPPEQREDSAKGFQETVSYIQATGRGIPPYILELEQLCKDGSRFWVETLFKALFDEKDRFMGFLGITRDISERKKAMFQAQKHTDEQLLLASIANSLVGMESRDQMFDFIAQQVYNLCSDTYLVLSHLDEESEAFMLKSAYGFSDHFDNLQKYFGINPFKMALSLKDYPQDLLELLRNKKMNLFEINGIHKVSAGVLSRKIGKLIENFLGIKRAYIMGISWNDKVYGAFACFSKSEHPLENLTLIETIINQSSLAVQRLYTSEELKRSESRYRSLVEMSPDGIGLFQLKGQLVNCNLEMARIFGYEDENDLLSQNFNAFNLIHPADQAKINKGLRLLMKGKPVPLEYYKLLRKDGSTFPGEVHSVIVQDEMGNSNLLLSIIRDVTERVKAEEALARYNEQLRNFAGHNEMVREKERMNLARDIHDILGSSLAGLKMELAVLKRQLSEDIPGTKPDIPRQISAMSLQINDSVELMRKIVRELRPGILDELGLAEAFKWYAGELESRSNISFMLQTSRAEIKLDKNLSVVIFRIFQEIMTNIVLHSKASRVHIRVEMHHNLFKLTVNDNGIGIKPEAVDKTDSFGLLGMRERAMLLNGKLSIFGEPAKGTTVILEVPIDNI